MMELLAIALIAIGVSLAVNGTWNLLRYDDYRLGAWGVTILGTLLALVGYVLL